MHRQFRARSAHGFTIVELLIVVVVIAILATISMVAYRNIQDRARTSAADSILSQAGKKLALYKAEQETYPNSLSIAGINGTDSSATLDYSASGGGYCLSATIADVSRSISAASQNPSTGNCDAALSKWTFNGATFNGATNQITLNPTMSATSRSPLIANTGRSSARITLETYATSPAPSRTPNSGMLFESRYFASDKTTPVSNSIGYTGNGDAACVVPLNTWKTCSWTTPTGPNVQWVQFNIVSSPGQYTSDNIIRNVQITIID